MVTLIIIIKEDVPEPTTESFKSEKTIMGNVFSSSEAASRNQGLQRLKRIAPTLLSYEEKVIIFKMVAENKIFPETWDNECIYTDVLLAAVCKELIRKEGIYMRDIEEIVL